MMNRIIAGITAALLAGSAPVAAHATELVIYHTWSAPPEVAALNVLKKNLEAKGHTWTDIAIPHDTGSNVNLMNLVAGGNPPNLFMESNPGVYRDLTKQGFGRPLTDFFKDHGYPDKYPDAVAHSMVVDDQVMKVPTALHIDGMVYYNMDVAKKLGVDPTAWTSLDQMFADFDKIKAAGVIPLAVGGQQWQVGYLTHALAATIGGQDFFNRIYGEKPDPAVFDAPEFKQVFEYLRKFQQAADSGSANREWNLTTNLVITGKALMQIHGDWMKGEWLAAGKTAGKDFGCIQIPGAKAVVASVDSWGLLGGQSADKDKAELDFASIVIDPNVQADFAKAKGSTPVRLDAPQDSLDACSKEVLKIVADPKHQVQNPHAISDADWENSIWDVVFNFWSDPNMSVDDAISKIKENYQTILG